MGGTVAAQIHDLIEKRRFIMPPVVAAPAVVSAANGIQLIIRLHAAPLLDRLLMFPTFR